MGQDLSSTKTPKNIIISHVYSSDNNGDAALTSVLIDDLRRQFPEANLCILKLDHVNRGDEFEGVPEYPSFMNHAVNRYKNPLVKLAYTLYMLPATLLWAKVRRATGVKLWLPSELREVAETYAASDMVVAVGGGYIRSRRGLFNRLNIPLILHPLWFGRILGKPTVLYSQSVGPFLNFGETAMVRYVLNKMTRILIREDKSVELLRKIGVEENVVRAVDSGFLLRGKEPVDLRAKYRIPPGKLIVGVTVRAWLKPNGQEKYEQSVADTLDKIIDKYNAHVLFIPQVTASKGDDDRLTSRQVFERMSRQGSATLIDERLNHHQIKSLYDGLDVLLGTRFHSVIFSLTSYVPVVAIEYEHKTSGIMHDLGLEQWVVHIEEVTAEVLSELMEDVIAQVDGYKEHLRKYLPPYISKAQQAVEIAAEGYDESLEDSR